MKKRNYKVYCDIGAQRHLLRKVLTVLDTGAGPNFIRKSELTQHAEISTNGPLPSVADANDNPIKMIGTTSLVVRLGHRLVKIAFIVCETLAAPMILGCDFCDRFVEAIFPRQKTVLMDDGTTVPITRRPLRRSPKLVPLPPEQEYGHDHGRKSPKIRIARKIELPPASQTWVTVTSQRHGVMVVQPDDGLYAKHGIAPTNGIVQVMPDEPFRILIANFNNGPKTLSKNQVIGTLLPHPTAVYPSRITIAEVLGLVEAPEGDKNSTVGDELTSEPKPTPRNVDDLDLSHVPARYQERLRTMLRKYSSMWDGSLGEITTTEHAIELLPGTKPISQPPYRAGPKQRQIEQDEVNRMLEQGVIDPAQTAWASPVVLVPKPDGSLRFCVDYRRLNAVTIRDSYPLPRMDEYIDSLGDASMFTTLDCNSGYWQIPVREEDREKTAFVTHSGLYQYRRMPFGLTNAPATFQRTLDILLSPYKWRSCLVYLDDVIIYSKDIESHFEAVEAILDTLQKAGISLKLAKCNWFTDEVKYLGHVIRPGTLSVDDTTTRALSQAKHPRTQSELRSFLGLCNVYRRFVRSYSHIAAPLNALLRKDKPVKLDPFGESEDKAFRTLIQAITSPPILALPKADLPYTVDTDASDYQVGCALFQTKDGERRPIGFWSRSLNSAEKNYSTPEKECLAVVWALTTLRPYLMSERFTVFSDQASLRWLLTINAPSGRLTRWRLRLSEFDFEIRYKKGICNTQADALSRLQTLGETSPDIDDDIPCFLIEGDTVILDDDLDFMSQDYAEHDALLLQSERDISELLVPITADELVRAQAQDTFCQAIRAKLNGGEVLPFADDENGYLVRTVEAFPQIVVPTDLRLRILHIHHYAKLSAHPGGRKLYNSLRRDFYWPAMAVDAYGTVKNCISCARNRVTLRKNAKQMHLFPAESPLDFVSIDLLGELITSSRGNRFLLVITDRFSKLVRTVPLKRITAAIIAREFVRHWVLVYGPPSRLLSDNGKQFTAKFFQDVCRILGIKNVFTTTYHPQCNGQVERFNRTIIAALRHYVADHPKEWDLFTDSLTYAYNTQVHSTTGVAPFDLVVSRRTPALSLQAEPTVSEAASAKHHMIKWKTWLAALMSTAKDKLSKRQAKYKLDFDRRLRRHTEVIRSGDRVFVKKDYSNPNVDPKHKLSPVATGPYDVVEVNHDTVVVETDDNIRERLSRDRVTLAPKVVDMTANATDTAPQPPNPSITQTDAAPQNTNNRGLADLPAPPIGEQSNFNSRVWIRQPIKAANPHPCVPPKHNNGDRYENPHDTATTADDGKPSGEDDEAATDGWGDEVAPRKPNTRSRTHDTPPHRRTSEAANRIQSDKPDPSNEDTARPSDKIHRTDPSPISEEITPIPDELQDTPDPENKDTNRHDTEEANAQANGKTEAGLDLNGGEESRPLRRSSRLHSRQATKYVGTSNSSQTTPPKEQQRKVSFSHPEAVVVDEDQYNANNYSDLPGVHDQKFVVEKILNHAHAEDGELLHQVRWYGYPPDSDTWEPTRNLPRNMLIRYYKRRELPLPSNINETTDG